MRSQTLEDMAGVRREMSRRPGRSWQFLALQRRRPLFQVILAFVFPGIALLACEIFREVLAPAFEAPFITAVALAAWFGGPYCGLASTGLSALAAVYFFIPPYNAFAISDLTGWVHLLTFSGTNIIITGLIYTLSGAREGIRDAETRFRSAAELIPFGLWRADANGNMLELSEQFLNACGISMTRAAGMGWAELIVPEERQMVVAAWRDCVEHGDFWDSEYHVRSKDGSVYTVLSRGVPVFSNNGKSWIGIHLDITERDKAAELRVMQERNLARFNAELDQFAYVAAHDLQEPLRMIASYLQLIARRYKDKLDEDGQTFVNYSVEGANRLQALLSGMQMLSVIGKSPERRKLTRVSDAAEKAKENVGQKLKAVGGDITWNELPTVTCDRFEIAQLFENLFDNSLKFSPEGQPVHITISADKEPGVWHFAVRDNGIGFNPEYANRIFELFQRLNPRDQYPGTGIGLTICKKIVEVHGGRIWAESAPGQGTTVHFTLPG